MPASVHPIRVETEAQCLPFGHHLIEVTNQW